MGRVLVVSLKMTLEVEPVLTTCAHCTRSRGASLEGLDRELVSPSIVHGAGLAHHTISWPRGNDWQQTRQILLAMLGKTVVCLNKADVSNRGPKPLLSLSHGRPLAFESDRKERGCRGPSSWARWVFQCWVNRD